MISCAAFALLVDGKGDDFVAVVSLPLPFSTFLFLRRYSCSIIYVSCYSIPSDKSDFLLDGYYPLSS